MIIRYLSWWYDFCHLTEKKNYIKMKLYIISNRLPVKAVAEKDTFVFSRSEGGLTTGLNSLQGNYEKHWVGWPGICTDKEEEKQDICHRLEEMNLHPIFLSDEQYKNYYEGYSNSTLWPLCHYFLPIHYIERVSGNLTKRLTFCFVGKSSALWNRMIGSGYKIIS